MTSAVYRHGRTSSIVPIPATQTKTPSTSDSSLKSIFEILLNWGMITQHGTLTYATSVQPRPLKDQSLRRWNALLDKDTQICIQKFQLKLKQKDFASGFSDYASHALRQEVKTYLRGGFAQYVVNLPEYFEELIDDFLSDKEGKERKKQEIAPYLQELKEKWEKMPIPSDVDWLDLVDNSDSPYFKDLPASYLAGLRTGLDPNKVKETGFSKFVLPRPTLLKMEKSPPYIIWAPKLKVGSLPIDRTSGNLKHVSLASWCDIFIPIDPERDPYGNPLYIPTALSCDFHQMVLDWGLNAIRIQEWHRLNFPALAAFCQYASQGFDLVPSAEELPKQLINVWSTMQNHEEAYQAFFDDINRRLDGHRLEKVSFLFSVAMQFFLGFSYSPDHLKIWQGLLLKMEETVKDKDKDHIDFRLVDFFKLFKDDFSKLVSALVHLAVAAAQNPKENISIPKVNKEALLLKIGNNHLYLRKDLFGKNFSSTFPKEALTFLPLQDLKFGQKEERPLQEIVKTYVESTLNRPVVNSYLLYCHLSKADPRTSLPPALKSCLLLFVDSKATPDIDRELLTEWLTPWYPGLKGKKNAAKGAEALGVIAKTSFEDATATYQALSPELRRSLLTSFAIEISAFDSLYAVELLMKGSDLSEKEKIAAVRGILKNGKLTAETSSKLVPYLKTFDRKETTEELFPYAIRKLWEENRHEEGNQLFTHSTIKKLIKEDEIEKLGQEFAKKESALSCHLFYLEVTPFVSLSTKFKERLGRKDTDAQDVSQEVETAVRPHIEKFLKENKYKEALNHLLKFVKFWKEETYGKLLLQIFKSGGSDREFIFEIVSTLPRFPTSPSAEFREIYLDFLEKLIKTNVLQALPLLFSTFSFKILPEDEQTRLRSLASKDKAGIFSLFGYLLSHSISNNIVLIADVIEFFADSWNSSLGRQQELVKLLNSHGPEIVVTLMAEKRFDVLVKLQHLLNLLDVKTSFEQEEAFLESLEHQFSLEIFTASLQNHRFSSSGRRDALVLRGIHERKGRSELTKVLIKNLSIDFSSDFIKEICKEIEDDTLSLEILLKRFSQDEGSLSTILACTQDTPAFKRIPLQKICQFVEKWTEIVSPSNLTVLHPVVVYLLQHPIPLFDVIKKTRFSDPAALTTYFIKAFERKEFGGKEPALSLLFSQHILKDRTRPTHPYYPTMWKTVILGSLEVPVTPTNKETFIEVLLFTAWDKDLLDLSGTLSYRQALLQKVIPYLERDEDFNAAIETWKDLEPSLEITEEIVEKIDQQEPLQRMFDHLPKWKGADEALLEKIALTILCRYKPENLEPSYFKDLFTQSKQPEDYQRFFSALLNQEDTLVEAIDYTKVVSHLPKSVYQQILRKFSQVKSPDPDLEKSFLESLENNDAIVDESFQHRKNLLLFNELDHVVHKKFDLSKFEDLLNKLKSHDQVASTWILDGIIRAIPLLDGAGLTSLFLKGSEACQLSMDTEQERKKLYSWTIQFLQRVRDVKLLSSKLLNTVFISLAKFFTDHYILQDSKDHLEHLFYFGLSLSSEKELYDTPHGQWIQKIALHFEQDENKFCEMMYGLKKFHSNEYVTEKEEIEEKSRYSQIAMGLITDPTANLMTESLFLYPSTYNLERVFCRLKTMVDIYGYRLSARYFEKLIKCFNHIQTFCVEPAGESLFEAFMDLFTANSIGKNKEDFQVINAEFFKAVYARFFSYGMVDANCPERLIVYYRMFLNAKRLGYETGIIPYQVYLNLVEEHVDTLKTDPQAHDIIASIVMASCHCQPEEDSPIEIVAKALLYRRQTKEETALLQKRNQLLIDWLFPFFEFEHYSPKRANKFLSEYLDALHLQGENPTRLEKIRVCLRVNKGKVENLKLIEKALLSAAKHKLRDQLLAECHALMTQKQDEEISFTVKSIGSQHGSKN